MSRFSKVTSLAVFLTLLALSLPARAQTTGEGSLMFVTGVPQGEFADNIDRLGYGAGLTFGAFIPNTPVFLGVDGGFMIYGYDTRREPFSPTIPEVRVDVVTSNNIANGHFLVRLQPPTGIIRPYVEGLFGFKYLFTETRVEDDSDYDDEPIASSTNFDDFALSYGTGGGLAIQVWQGRVGEEKRPAGIRVNAGVRYLFGGTAEYLKEGSIRRNGTEVTFDVERSETNMLTPYIGVGFAF